MLQSKLNKLLRRAGISCYDEYYNLLINKRNNDLWNSFVDEITIHKTDFFREENHFEYIKNNINTIFQNNPRITRNNEIRIWSSACSTGEEPYTIAMVLKECLPEFMNIRILGTDISNKVITHAQRGVFDSSELAVFNSFQIAQYFDKIGNQYVIKPTIKELITFRTFNLIQNFPFKNTFDIIFSRNVMIYFNNATQEELIKKYYNVLTVGGLLFIGHSESLTQKQYKFKYIHPTIYMRTL
jgi:chemotaxis protein methyltransferase CheR